MCVQYESSFNFETILVQFVKDKQETYLMQFSGSPSQSVLHLNRSHDSHPIGGVLASPFSNASILGTDRSNPKLKQTKVEKDITAQLFLLSILWYLGCVLVRWMI